MSDLVPVERIENMIYLIRGQKVMLDFDLADLYGVRTKVLNQAIKRNLERFPDDFMFQLTWDEVKRLRSQFVTLKNYGHKILKRGHHIKYLPYAFTENGVAMLSSVLRSKYAVQVNIQIMRAFTRLRRLLTSHIEVSKKLKELELRLNKHDVEIRRIFDAIKKMIEPDNKRIEKIGFVRDVE